MNPGAADAYELYSFPGPHHEDKSPQRIANTALGGAGSRLATVPTTQRRELERVPTADVHALHRATCLSPRRAGRRDRHVAGPGHDSEAEPRIGQVATAALSKHGHFSGAPGRPSDLCVEPGAIREAMTCEVKAGFGRLDRPPGRPLSHGVLRRMSGFRAERDPSCVPERPSRLSISSRAQQRLTAAERLGGQSGPIVRSKAEAIAAAPASLGSSPNPSRAPTWH